LIGKISCWNLHAKRLHPATGRLHYISMFHFLQVEVFWRWRQQGPPKRWYSSRTLQ